MISSIPSSSYSSAYFPYLPTSLVIRFIHILSVMDHIYYSSPIYYSLYCILHIYHIYYKYAIKNQLCFVIFVEIHLKQPPAGLQYAIDFLIPGSRRECRVGPVKLREINGRKYLLIFYAGVLS